MPVTEVEEDLELLPLDGGELLDKVEQALRHYVVLPSEQSLVAVVLWTVATHAITEWDYAPRLVVVSPEKRCGKSRLLEVVEAMSASPIRTVNISVAALYRLVNRKPYTILHDEADTVFGKRAESDPTKEELRAFYNGGFQRGQQVYRAGPGPKSVVAFKTFAMAALAAIGDLPDTIMDRAVVVRMRRRKEGEEVAPLRQRNVPKLQELGEKLSEWAQRNAEELAEAIPATPLVDRAADVWEPLLAVADAVGGRWPVRAREAALHLTKGESTMAEEPLGQRLLRDIRSIWPAEQTRMASKVLVDTLRERFDVTEVNWMSYGKDGLNPQSMAALLKPYELLPVQLKLDGGKNLRGYDRKAFEGAWDRYLDGGR